MATQEFNFDGLVGPTHNYAGLSHGNVASAKSQSAVSSPKAAALQGLEKMKFVRDLGIEQCVLPPLVRPKFEFLRELGFCGSDAELIDRAFQFDPVLLAASYSASSMWTANAATVSPSSDCGDGRLHLTPANLVSNLHRSIEATETTRILRAIFADRELFQVHDPLPGSAALADEGAANHTRLGASYDQPGIEFFVYGTRFLNADSVRPKLFPARQTLEASQAIARHHLLNPNRCLFAQQNPDAIDAGVFHNDVIATGHQNVLLCHESAFCEQATTLRNLTEQYEQLAAGKLHIVSLADAELPLADAVSSYLFNSQILTRPDGTMVLVCPVECQTNPNANQCVQKIMEANTPIEKVQFLDLRQSMNNGGGPACLRLRVVLNDRQQQRFHQGVRLTDELYRQLVAWVERHYRDQLAPNDLRDPRLADETQAAMQDLSELLLLPGLVLKSQ